MMKTSLDTIGYPAYFYDGKPLTLEEALERTAKFGFDALEIWPHRPIGCPLDISKDRRKRLVEQAQKLALVFSGVGPSTDFTRPDHILARKQEKEIMYVKECCELAQDLGTSTVRIFGCFRGYLWPLGGEKGYGNVSWWNTRTIEVSQEKDFLQEWEFVKAAVKECAEIAADYNVTLALQNHPPLTNNTEETLEMIEEIDHPNLKMCLDLPLFESQDKDFIWDMVRRVGRQMVHSHVIGIQFLQGLTGPYGFKEVSPENGRENWIEFFKACHEVGYDGYFAHEQCSPVILKGHKIATIEEFDKRYEETAKWMKKVFADIEAGKL